MTQKDFTVGYLIDQLKRFPRETVFCFSDMDGNNIYGCDIADYTDMDNPNIEFILPIYLKKISIEQGYENDIFINNVEIVNYEE